MTGVRMQSISRTSCQIFKEQKPGNDRKRNKRPSANPTSELNDNPINDWFLMGFAESRQQKPQQALG